MSRIASTFTRLKANRRKALIPFITVGDPNLEMTVPLMRALVDSGADIIELGVPFSDPMADGPTIQRSSERALKHHTNLRAVLEAVARFRAVDDSTPVVLMGYANPIEAITRISHFTCVGTRGAEPRGFDMAGRAPSEPWAGGTGLGALVARSSR